MSVEFHWDGTSGSVQNGTKYNLLYTKPTIMGVTYGKVTYVDTDLENSYKVLDDGGVFPLTSEEQAILKRYAIDNSVVSPWTPDDAALAAHNVDLNAHQGIHYSVSELAEVTHKVASVFTTQYDLKTMQDNYDVVIPWLFVALDDGNCTDPLNNTVWRAPFAENYDVELNLHFTAARTATTQTITVRFKVNGIVKVTKSFTINPSGNPSKNIKVPNLTIGYREALTVEVHFEHGFTEGAFLPYRTYLTVGSSGDCTATRCANLLYNTLGGLVTTLGTEIYTKQATADPTKTRVLAGSWDATKEEIK